jgi:SnoaL-like domain
MQSSTAVVDGLVAFYAAYCSHDPDTFADALATGDGVSIIGTAPGEGRPNREEWIAGYSASIPNLGLRLEAGPEPRGYAEGSLGFAVDQPRFVLPDARFVAARLTAVLRLEAERWKVVHLHFSVGVPDSDTLGPPRPCAPPASSPPSS